MVLNLAGLRRAGKAVEEETKKVFFNLKTIKSSLGGRSDFKDIIEIIRGAGPIAGLHLLGRSLNDFATKTEQIVDGVKSGRLEVGQIHEELLSSLPLLGQFYQAVLRIRDTFSGELAKQRELNFELDRQLQLALKNNRTVKELKELIGEAKQAQSEFNDEIRLMRVPEEFRNEVQADVAFGQRMRKIHDEFEKLRLMTRDPDIISRINDAEFKRSLQELEQQDLRQQENRNRRVEAAMKQRRQDEIEAIEEAGRLRMKWTQEEADMRNRMFGESQMFLDEMQPVLDSFFESQRRPAPQLIARERRFGFRSFSDPKTSDPNAEAIKKNTALTAKATQKTAEEMGKLKAAEVFTISS